MERELALEFVRVTEGAALAAAPWMGRGDKEAIDGAAVETMRALFDNVDIDGTVVIGEGEMDEAPMLYIGERLGTGRGPRVDVAVDPVEGTNLVARGLPDAIAVVAVAPRGTLLHAPDMYMQKIAVGPEAAGKVDIDAPPAENVRRVAKALGKEVSQVTVILLDRPRHEQIVRQVREVGARIRFISDGDVLAALATALPESGVDLLLGIGGAPEGVLAAAALRCLGGELQARLLPQDDQEAARCQAMGIRDPGQVLTMHELVRGDDVIFSATGITPGSLLRGVRFARNGAETETLVMRAWTGTVRRVRAFHHPERKPVLRDLPAFRRPASA
ncbi:MAG: class II fructose-bisphosphatase [Bacillota bacterium]|nr:class II fructose-bisphosphatase [Bacillota bacterium]